MSGVPAGPAKAESPTGAASAATLGVLLRSGGHEAAHYALVLATGAAAIGRPAVIFATNAGLALLRHDAPLAADPREALIEARGVAGIATLLDAARELSVRLIACEAGLRAEAIPPDALAPGVEVAGVVTFFSVVGAGQIVSL
jgi:peroxiredoxin family protein